MFTLSKLNISKQINFASKCFQLIPKVAGMFDFILESKMALYLFVMSFQINLKKFKGERTNFAPTFYGMDKFTRHTEYVTQRHSSDLGIFSRKKNTPNSFISLLIYIVFFSCSRFDQKRRQAKRRETRSQSIYRRH